VTIFVLPYRIVSTCYNHSWSNHHSKLFNTCERKWSL